ncbi:glycosyltransferase family 4 protein [uncultured Pseudoteredinibacter sp.]|uniref:glycosyltransferase family 4 protein n=1 Tax=uncultured Pseudoteredinibacter sp. TaxID=1641701 RepID=UPI00261C2610|nr:glycosyltransferase family 4 protein [uncultured Pseudoteredinibacter sp.]
MKGQYELEPTQGSPTIYSQVVSGSGVEVVHNYLAENLSNYTLNTLSPKLGALPCLIPSYKGNSDIIHTTAELGTRGFTASGKNLLSIHNYYYDERYLSSVRDIKRRLYYKHIARGANVAACKKADHIVTVSNFLADIIKQEINPKTEISVIHNGIDTQRFTKKKKNHEKPRILFAGNPIARKGFDIFKAVATALSHKADFWATGGLQNHKQAHSDHIRFIPKVPYSEMPTIFQESDILLFPSHREGFGLVVAEAMACGQAVVCSNNSALPELIDSDLGGLLVNSHEYKDWVKAVETLIDSSHLRQEFGNYNRHKAEQCFGLEKMLTEYQLVFQSLKF